MLTGPPAGSSHRLSRPLWMSAAERNFLKRSRTLAPGSEADQATSRKWSDLRPITYVRPDSSTLATSSGLRGTGESMQEIPSPMRSGDPLFAVTVASPWSRTRVEAVSRWVARIADAAGATRSGVRMLPWLALPHSLTPCAGRA